MPDGVLERGLGAADLLPALRTGGAPGRVDSAPMSMIVAAASTGSASTRARLAMARDSVRRRKNESGRDVQYAHQRRAFCAHRSLDDCVELRQVHSSKEPSPAGAALAAPTGRSEIVPPARLEQGAVSSALARAAPISKGSLGFAPLEIRRRFLSGSLPSFRSTFEGGDRRPVHQADAGRCGRSWPRARLSLREHPRAQLRRAMLRTRVKAGPIAGLVLSLVAAIILTLVQSGDLFVRRFTPVYDAPVRTALRIPYGPRIVRDWSSGRAELRLENFRVVVPPGRSCRTRGRIIARRTSTSGFGGRRPGSVCPDSS